MANKMKATSSPDESHSNPPKEETNENTNSSKPPLKKTKLKNNSGPKDEVAIVRGKPKSGRIWKTQKERFTTAKTTIRGKRTCQQLAFREEMKEIKSLSQSIKDTRSRENLEKKLRREENNRRRLENERKSETVQIINNPIKLKRMRKKQLRQIEKRDITKLNVV